MNPIQNEEIMLWLAVLGWALMAASLFCIYIGSRWSRPVILLAGIISFMRIFWRYFLADGELWYFLLSLFAASFTFWLFWQLSPNGERTESGPRD